MVTLVEQHGGTLDKFLGDGLMVFFGAPDAQDHATQAIQAVSMAVAMHERLEKLIEKWRDEGFNVDVKIRAGINQDFVTVGNFGSADLMEYTVIGNGVNLASRLETLCTPGKIAVTFPVYSLTKDLFPYVKLPDQEFRGLARSISVWELDPGTASL